MFRSSLIIVLSLLTSTANSSNANIEVSASIFKNTFVDGNNLITPSENFESTLKGELGIFKDITTGGVSKNSSFFLTDVDDSRYDENYQTLLHQLENTQVDEALLLRFSPALDSNSTYIVGKFSLNNQTYNGFIIAGKNKRASNQYVYEIYFECNGDLYSLTYFTKLNFEQVFT
jgi:hypothetical protein